MRFAYADPPYLGMCSYYGHEHGDGGCWDDPATHAELIGRLCGDYPDGWAMSMASTNLRDVLPMCPDDVRVMPWVKPFASFKPAVGVAYAWEPIVVRGGRPRTREQRTVRDWTAANITLQRGFIGAKPASVVHWLCDVLNVQPGDQFDDLFVGSGAVGVAVDGYMARPVSTPGTLFA